jgi:hypothetical protein
MAQGYSSRRAGHHARSAQPDRASASGQDPARARAPGPPQQEARSCASRSGVDRCGPGMADWAPILLDDLGAQGLRSPGPRTISSSGGSRGTGRLVARPSGPRWLLRPRHPPLLGLLSGSVRAGLQSRYLAIRLTGRPHQRGARTGQQESRSRPGRAVLGSVTVPQTPDRHPHAVTRAPAPAAPGSSPAP